MQSHKKQKRPGPSPIVVTWPGQQHNCRRFCPPVQTNRHSRYHIKQAKILRLQGLQSTQRIPLLSLSLCLGLSSFSRSSKTVASPCSLHFFCIVYYLTCTCICIISHAFVHANIQFLALCRSDIALPSLPWGRIAFAGQLLNADSLQPALSPGSNVRQETWVTARGRLRNPAIPEKKNSWGLEP